MHIEPNFMETLNFQTSLLLSIKDDQASGAVNRRESYNFDFLTDRNIDSGAVPTVDRQPIRTLSSFCQLCDRFSTRIGVFLTHSRSILGSNSSEMSQIVWGAYNLH